MKISAKGLKRLIKEELFYREFYGTLIKEGVTWDVTKVISNSEALRKIRSGDIGDGVDDLLRSLGGDATVDESDPSNVEAIGVVGRKLQNIMRALPTVSGLIVRVLPKHKSGPHEGELLPPDIHPTRITAVLRWLDRRGIPDMEEVSSATKDLFVELFGDKTLADNGFDDSTFTV